MKTATILISYFLVFAFFSVPKTEFQFRKKENLSLVSIDSTLLLNHLTYLASDELGGRLVGSEGNALARTYITSEITNMGLTYELQEFVVKKNAAKGFNIIVEIPGAKSSNQRIVVIAHYDHIGMKTDSLANNSTDLIYNGSDDNASGTSALLEIARYYSKNKPNYSIVLLFTDSEEMGLKGAHHFVDSYEHISHVFLAMNMDMISRNDQNTLNICGTSHTPSLLPLFETLVPLSDLNLTFSHDGKDNTQDWTNASDHYPFHKKGIPFVYYGVEDHSDYHKVGDESQKANRSFFVKSAELVLNSLILFDETVIRDK